MKYLLAVLLLLFLTGCVHSEEDQKKKPTEVIKMEEPQDWLIGRKINFLQRDNDVFMNRPEKPIQYFGYKNPDKIVIVIGRNAHGRRYTEF